MISIAVPRIFSLYHASNKQTHLSLDYHTSSPKGASLGESAYQHHGIYPKVNVYVDVETYGKP